MDRDRNRLWLLAYDIADARRWQRVYRARPTGAFHRINWSVFLGEATLREIEDLAAELNLLIDPKARRPAHLRPRPRRPDLDLRRVAHDSRTGPPAARPGSFSRSGIGCETRTGSTSRRPLVRLSVHR
ncbi:MAG: CRISPR-associated endonuclease Cas2 [Xanthomonadales bacterium]|nr:CRISPR-associated endonuclease Cas2 [Xanthomonadales bacterium]